MNNIKAWFARGPMKCQTKEEAAKWFALEVGLAMAASGVDQVTAETCVKEHLGYASGYFPLEVAERVYDLWGVAHPFFGTPKERANLRPEQAFAINQAIGKILRGQTDGEA